MKPIVMASSVALAAYLLAANATPAEDRHPNGPGMPGGQQFDCDQLAKMPSAPMSVETCKQMMPAPQMSQGASSGESAACPGDDAMSCDQIAAEMKSMRGLGPSEGARRESAAATQGFQEKMAKQQAEMNAFGAAASAAVQAGAAADAVTQVATGGLVQGHAAAAAAEAAQAQAKGMGERLAKERKPDEQRLYSATGNTIAEMTQQMQSNPRFARLVNLAIAKDCQEPGSR